MLEVIAQMSVRTSVWGVVMLLMAGLVVGALFIAVMLIRSREQVVRAIGWTVVVGCGVAPVLLVMVFSIRTATYSSLSLNAQAEQAADIAEVRRIEARASAERDGLRPAVWDTAEEATYTADQYSSEMVAANALAMKVKTEVQAILDAQDDAPLQLEIRTASTVKDLDTDEIVAAFTNTMRRELPELQVTAERAGSTQGTPGNRGPVIRIDVGVGSMGGSGRSDRLAERYGSLYANLRGVGDPNTIVCRFVVKRWIDSLDDFSRNHPDRTLVVASSRTFAKSETAASELAVADARDQLAIGEGSGEYDQLVKSDSLQIDRFVQRVSRTDGDVWRVAVLLDVSPDRVVLAQSQSRLRVYALFIQRVAGFLGLALVAIVIGMVLKALTRGGWAVPAVVMVSVVILLVVGSTWVFVRSTDSRRRASEPRLVRQQNDLKRTSSLHEILV